MVRRVQVPDRMAQDLFREEMVSRRAKVKPKWVYGYYVRRIGKTRMWEAPFITFKGEYVIGTLKEVTRVLWEVRDAKRAQEAYYNEVMRIP
jgi:hypothetical protein